MFNDVQLSEVVIRSGYQKWLSEVVISISMDREPSSRLGAVPFNTSSIDLKNETVRIETVMNEQY